MRIHTNTPDLLVLRHRPWLVSAIMLILVLAFAAGLVDALLSRQWAQLLPMTGGIVLALAFMWLTVRPAHLVADAQAGTLEVLQLSLLGRRHMVFPLDKVAKAEVRSKSFGREQTRAAWLSIYLDKGEMEGWHQVSTSVSGGGISRAAGYFNAWLKGYHAHHPAAK